MYNHATLIGFVLIATAIMGCMRKELPSTLTASCIDENDRFVVATSDGRLHIVQIGNDSDSNVQNTVIEKVPWQGRAISITAAPGVENAFLLLTYDHSAPPIHRDRYLDDTSPSLVLSCFQLNVATKKIANYRKLATGIFSFAPLRQLEILRVAYSQSNPRQDCGLLFVIEHCKIELGSDGTIDHINVLNRSREFCSIGNFPAFSVSGSTPAIFTYRSNIQGILDIDNGLEFKELGLEDPEYKEQPNPEVDLFEGRLSYDLSNDRSLLASSVQIGGIDRFRIWSLAAEKQVKYQYISGQLKDGIGLDANSKCFHIHGERFGFVHEKSLIICDAGKKSHSVFNLDTKNLDRYKSARVLKLTITQDGNIKVKCVLMPFDSMSARNVEIVH